MTSSGLLASAACRQPSTPCCAIPDCSGQTLGLHRTVKVAREVLRHRQRVSESDAVVASLALEGFTRLAHDSLVGLKAWFIFADRSEGGMLGLAAVAAPAARLDEFELVWLDAEGTEQRAWMAQAAMVAFEQVPPVRGFPSFRGQRSFPGSWWFATTGEHVGYESWLERDQLMALDADPRVVGAASQ